MQHKLIVFDWDGTLMDSVARIVACMQGAITDLGLAERNVDEIRNIIGLGLREAVAMLFHDLSEADYQALVARYRYHFLVGDKTPSLMFDGAVQLLTKLLDKGHFLAVATGKGRQGLDKVLEETGLKPVFHASRCADETFSKPHPQMLLDIMDELGIDAQETLMIGDTEYDMEMANNAGTAALAVSYGVHSKQRLLDCQPLSCVDTVNELSEWLLGNHSTALSTGSVVA